jgi:CubicO group peptidase (beta-lactamase class C family)
MLSKIKTNSKIKNLTGSEKGSSQINMIKPAGFAISPDSPLALCIIFPKQASNFSGTKILLKMSKSILLLFTLLVFAHNRVICQPAKANQMRLLDSMTTAVESNAYTDINSILIFHGEKLLYEHYFNGWTADSLHDVRSSFKSVTSLLMGIAIDKGFIKDVNQKVYSFFPEFAALANAEHLKKEMTIKNLLEMESGFDCEEFNDEKDCEATMVTTKDWVKFSLNLPMKNKPGTVWAYTSCNPMIVGGIISHVAKMSIMDFAKKYLFEPMGITEYRWTVDSMGQATTAGSFFIKSTDMMKFGELVLQNGIWHGKRIVSEKWVKESTHAKIPIPNFSFVKFSRSKIAIPQPTYYGYYWYNEVLRTKSYDQNVLFASGNGGQYIMIIPDLDLVIVFTQGNYGSWKAKRAFDILAKYILPMYK